jgi:hypothetical protein
MPERSGSSNSSVYRRANSWKRCGSCAYHVRSSVDGGTVLHHASRSAGSLHRAAASGAARSIR